MNVTQVIAQMNEAANEVGHDPEKLHYALDEILLDAMPAVIRGRYLEIRDEAKWWAFS